jgi:hypothetical protein
MAYVHAGERAGRVGVGGVEDRIPVDLGLLLRDGCGRRTRNRPDAGGRTSLAGASLQVVAHPAGAVLLCVCGVVLFPVLPLVIVACQTDLSWWALITMAVIAAAVVAGGARAWGYWWTVRRQESDYRETPGGADGEPQPPSDGDPR